jgi:FecR protein
MGQADRAIGGSLVGRIVLILKRGWRAEAEAEAEAVLLLPFMTGGEMKTTLHILTAGTLLVLFAGSEKVGAAPNEDGRPVGSVAIISSVNGEARVAHPTDTQQADQPKFRGPIIYGDHLSTGKNASLGLLVGQNSLLTMRELSEVRIAETVRNQQILELAKGKVCLAVSRSTDADTGPFTVRTPTSVITAAAGTLLSVEVEPAPQKSQFQEMEKGIVVLTAAGAQPSREAPASVVETYQVIEGSVDIVSQASGSSPVSLRAGQALRVTGGVRGTPFTAPIVNCRAQDVQIVPVHTNTPPPAQRMVVQQQMQLVGAERVAAMAQVSGAVPSGGSIPGGIYLPFPNDNSLVPTTRTTIRITLPTDGG